VSVFDDAMLRLAEALPSPLTVVDVGCRWGFADPWLRLGDQARVIGFDPDVEECRRLEERYRDRPSVRVVPQGLGAEPGAATLFVTKEPASSSLYRPSADAVDRHPALGDERLDHTETVHLTTLDEWAADAGVDAIDLVKLDTQGSELDILRGAPRSLASVRAIECEVQFNQLYEGVPLFGDLDRYLRAHGFVLWQFRNLAHHASERSRLDFNIPTRWFHDSYQADFHAKAGQLFWCDAFFVKRDVAALTPWLTWDELARDACLTSTFRFYDLAQVALDAALDTAPPEPAARIRAALTALEEMLREEDRLRAEQRDQLLAVPVRAVAAPPASPWRLERDSVPLVGAHTVHLADEFEGTGWGGLEAGVPSMWRWTGPGREAAIDLPLRVPPGTRVELLVVAARKPAILDELAVELNGLPVPMRHEHGPDGWTFTGVVPRSYAPSRRFTRVLLRTSETVPLDPPVRGALPAQGVGVARLTLTAPRGPA
jgi:FkbM family methyltransferase